MTLTAADIANDMAAVVDNLTTVSVLQVNPDTGATVTTDATVTVLKRAPDAVELTVDEGGIPVESCKWHLQASTCSFVPKKRDKIVDGSDTWVIDKVTKAAFATRYVCETTRAQS